MKALHISFVLLGVIFSPAVSGQISNPFAESNAKREAARQRDANRSMISRSRSAEASGLTVNDPTDPMRAPASSVVELVMQEGKLSGDKRVRDAESEFDTAPGSGAAARTEALALYPDLANPASPFSQRCRGLVQYFTGQNHPLLRNERYPLLIAHMAAIEIYGSAQRDARQTKNDAEVAASNAAQDEAYRMMQAAAPVGSSIVFLPPSAPAHGEPVPIVGKPSGVPKSFEIQMRPDGTARFDDGNSSKTKLDSMGRTRITFPGQIARGFAIPNDRDTGFVTMPDGSSRHFTKITSAGGSVKYRFQ